MTVTVKSKPVTMSLAEAERLQDELQRVITRVRSATSELLPPRLTCSGYITHSAMYEFFGQIYDPNGRELRIHAGKLFSRVTRTAWSGGSGIDVVCRDCGHLVHEVRHCFVTGHCHMIANVNLMIHAESLKKSAEAFIEAGHKGVGHAMINDLRMLCDHL